MAETMKLTDNQYLTVLYHIRQAARQVLSGDKARGADLQKYFSALAGAVSYNGADDVGLRQAFQEAVRSSLQTAAAHEVDIAFLRAYQVPEGVFAADKVEMFQKYQEQLKKAEADFVKLSAGEMRPVRPERETNVSAADSPTVAALKDEVAAYLDNRQKKDGAEMTAQKKEKLAAAKKLTVKRDKSGYLSVSADEEELARFGVAGMGLYFDGGKSSTYGKIPREIAAELIKFAKKTYATAAGEKEKKQDKNQTNQKKKAEEREKRRQQAADEVVKARQKLALAWKAMIVRADGVWAYQDLTSNDSHLLKGSGLTRDDAASLLTQGIMDSPALWAQYQERAEIDRFDKSSVYDVLVKRCCADDDARLQQHILSTYDKYKQGNSLAIKLAAGELKRMALEAQIPEDVVRQAFLDQVYRFGMPQNGSQVFDQDKFDFMNKVLETEGIHIALKPQTITTVCDSEKRLNDDIHGASSNKVKAYKKQMTALMYDMGRKLAQSSATDLVYDKTLCGQFGALCQAYDADFPRDDRVVQAYWAEFVKNNENREKAKEAYALLCEEYGDPEKAEQVVRLLRERQEIPGASLHHVVYAYYAPLFGRDEKALVAQFNDYRNTVEVLHAHPALADMHKEVEHRFNISGGGGVLVKRDGQTRLRTVRTCQPGDVLFMPIVEVRSGGDKGRFEPLMQSNMLFMTSAGKAVREPQFAGRGGNQHCVENRHINVRA